MTAVTGPASSRIAAEIRGQIQSGERAAGERVPSTREITRRWGVAMATASKVLATLKEEGLVHTRGWAPWWLDPAHRGREPAPELEMLKQH